MYVKFRYWYIAFPKAVSVYSPSDYMWECLIIQISIILLALQLLCWDEPLLFVVFIILLMFELVLFNNIVCVWEWVYVWALCVCVYDFFHPYIMGDWAVILIWEVTFYQCETFKKIWTNFKMFYLFLC